MLNREAPLEEAEEVWLTFHLEVRRDCNYQQEEIILQTEGIIIQRQLNVNSVSTERK